MARTRYGIVMRDTVPHLISDSSTKIIKALRRGEALPYADLQRKTRIPMQSLYVFVGRLRKGGLVKKDHVVDHDGAELVAYKLANGVSLERAKYVG